MKLLTKEIIANLEKAPLYSTDGKNIVPVIGEVLPPSEQLDVVRGRRFSGLPRARLFWTAQSARRNHGPSSCSSDWLTATRKSLATSHYPSLNPSGISGLKIERDMHFDGYVLNKKGSPQEGEPTVHYAGKQEVA